MKKELKRHSYLTMSKNVSTADQIIKMIELNGGRASSQDYTASEEDDLARKVKHVRHFMNLFKELNFDDWHTITVENLQEWMKKLSRLSHKDLKVHNVFHPADLERDL
jgi:Fic family protein